MPKTAFPKACASRFSMVSVLALSAAMAGHAAPAFAQEAAVSDRVVVTGSRIVRRDFQANTPIVTVQQDLLQGTSDISLDQTLRNLPQFAASPNSQFNTSYFSTGAATLNMRNLGDNRNLVLLDGRRLQPSTSAFAIDVNTIPSLLVESVEVITGGASAVYGSDAVSGVVNFKLRQNFEGLHVDAQYGMAEGGDNRSLDLGALFGGNVAGGRGNVVFALNYADRSPVYYRDRDFYQRSFQAGRAVQSANTSLSGMYVPGANGPSQEAVNAYFAQFGAPPGGVSNGINFGFNNDADSLFNVNGTQVYNYRNGLFPDDPRFTIDDTSQPGRELLKANALYNSYLSVPMERYSAFARGEYDLTDHVSVFAHGMFTNYVATVGGTSPAASGSWDVQIPRDAAHPIPADLAALLDSRANPGANWGYGNSLTFMGQQTLRNETNLFQLLGGLRGEIPGMDWTWEIYGSHGRTKFSSEALSGFASRARLRELMNAPFYGQNYSSPAGGTCTSGILPFGELVSSRSMQNGIVNANPTTFNTGVIGPDGQEIVLSQVVTDDCLDFLSVNLKNMTDLRQDVVEANLQGGLFDLPAGEVRFAVGVGYRSNTFHYNPDDALAPDSDYRSDTIGQFGVSPLSGSTDVAEAYGELYIPLIADRPFIRMLDVNLGYRFSEYPAGGASAYKIDANWQPVDGLRFRGGYQRAVRAANALERFSPPTMNMGLLPDPCEPRSNLPYGNVADNPNRAQVQDLCRAIMGPNAPADLDNYVSNAGASFLLSFPKGNPDLEPEKANTYTLGAVLQPNWNLPMGGRFSLSVDYYNVDIEGAIGFVSAPVTYQLCFNANGISNPTLDPSNPYCQTIVRSQEPAAYFAPTLVDNQYENQGGIKTDGVDIQADLAFDVGRGQLAFNGVVNYLNSFKRSIAVGSEFLEYAGTAGGYYRWKTYLSTAYSLDGATIGLRWRHLSGVEDSTIVNDPNSTVPPTDSYDVFDLFGRYALNDRIDLRGGVDNLFNRNPVIVSGLPGHTDTSNYDALGRRFYVGVTSRF